MVTKFFCVSLCDRDACVNLGYSHYAKITGKKKKKKKKKDLVLIHPLANPRLTKLFFVTRFTKGVVAIPSLDFPNRTPYEISFGINR